MVLASPKGGEPPLDRKATSLTPRPRPPSASTATARRRRCWPTPTGWIRSQPRISTRCSTPVAMAAMGPGEQPDLHRADRVLRQGRQAGRAVLPCAGGVDRVRGKDGEYLVKGKRVTGFTNGEEAAVELTEVVPFLLEDRLRERGGQYSRVRTGRPMCGRRAAGDRAEPGLIGSGGAGAAPAAARGLDVSAARRAVPPGRNFRTAAG